MKSIRITMSLNDSEPAVSVRLTSPSVRDTGLLDGALQSRAGMHKGSLQCLLGHMNFICPVGHD